MPIALDEQGTCHVSRCPGCDDRYLSGRKSGGWKSAPRVRFGSMLSKKSKIEQLSKSRERRCLPAVASASLCRARTKLCGRLLVIRRGPSHRRARHAPAVLEKFVPLAGKTFFTASVRERASL